MRDEDKTFSGFLVLDLRIWCQVHTLYRKVAFNEEKAVHEWQQKVKHVMKESNSQYFIRSKKPRKQLY